MGTVLCTYCKNCVYKGDEKDMNYKFRCEAKNNEVIEDRLEPIKCYSYK